MDIAIDGISGKCRVLLAGMIVAISKYQQGLKIAIVAMTTIKNFSDTLKS